MNAPYTEEPANDVPESSIIAAREILVSCPPVALPLGKYQALKVIDADKYLGVYVDTKLNFNKHVDSICAKATKVLNLCRRNLTMCPPPVKEIAYKSLVRP